MENKEQVFAFENTKPIPGQESYLFTYILLSEEKDGILGYIKVMSTHDSPQACQERYKKKEVWSTNRNAPMKWGISGHWEVLRRPETDTEGTIDIVKVEDDDEEDFLGEKLVRDSPKKNEKMEEIKQRAEMDMFKDRVKKHKHQEKLMKMRQQAMKELEEEMDDPTALASYAQLHYKRLVHKSQIAELREKIEEAQTVLVKNIEEIKKRDRVYPTYQSKWQNEIRRIQKIAIPKHASENPVDKPIAKLERDDDMELAKLEIKDVKDPFDSGVGVEAKKIGRNDKCPCDSGKKYKKCHGENVI